MTTACSQLHIEQEAERLGLSRKLSFNSPATDASTTPSPKAEDTPHVRYKFTRGVPRCSIIVPIMQDADPLHRKITSTPLQVPEAPAGLLDEKSTAVAPSPREQSKLLDSWADLLGVKLIARHLRDLRQVSVAANP